MSEADEREATLDEPAVEAEAAPRREEAIVDMSKAL